MEFRGDSVDWRLPMPLGVESALHLINLVAAAELTESGGED